MAEAVTTAAESAFLRELVKQFRAQDTYGSWDGKSDEQVLAPYILDAEARKAIPMMDDPDPDTLWRLELYYTAVGMAVERATGVMAQPLIKMHHEGFGRVVVTAGRLIVLNKYLRDVHRFGFDSLEKLAAQGDRMVADAVAMIEKFPEVARYS